MFSKALFLAGVLAIFLPNVIAIPAAKAVASEVVGTNQQTAARQAAPVVATKSAISELLFPLGKHVLTLFSQWPHCLHQHHNCRQYHYSCCSCLRRYRFVNNLDLRSRFRICVLGIFRPQCTRDTVSSCYRSSSWYRPSCTQQHRYHSQLWSNRGTFRSQL